MSHELLAALGGQILADLACSSSIGALPSTNGIKGKQDKLSKLVQAPIGEDMDARLRSIRHYITPNELAALLHCHIGTVYRMIKAGMPADRDVDAQGHGRRLKIYPPQVADRLRSCREVLRGSNQLTSSLPSPSTEASKSDKVVQWRK
jgi:hypothetical protein